METENPDVESQQVAIQLMFTMAGGATKEVSALSTWFIGGVGALLAVVVNGAEALTPFFHLEYLSDAIRMFIGAAAINVLQRWIGAMVTGAVDVSKEVQKLFEGGKFSPKSRVVALKIIADRSTPPVTWMMRKSMRSMEKGDLVAGAVNIARLSQIQSVLLIPQFALLGLAAWVLIP